MIFFAPVPRVPGICVPWDDFGTAKILEITSDSSPRDSPGISEFSEKICLLIKNAAHCFKWIFIAPKLKFLNEICKYQSHFKFLKKVFARSLEVIWGHKSLMKVQIQILNFIRPRQIKHQNGAPNLGYSKLKILRPFKNIWGQKLQKRSNFDSYWKFTNCTSRLSSWREFFKTISLGGLSKPMISSEARDLSYLD